MYRAGIQKFPLCAPLRTAYGLFLIEHMNKKQEAAAELAEAERLQPSFEEQFVIYRYKKKTEEFSEESQMMMAAGSPGAGGKAGAVDKTASNAVDIMAKFAFENTFRQLQTQIERCTHFHIEFWNLLKDERPDLLKLGDTGIRINNIVSNVE